jgi:hypothetical protein
MQEAQDYEAQGAGFESFHVQIWCIPDSFGAELSVVW